MRKVAGRLRLDLAQFRELQAFAQFGSDLDAATQKQLLRGERMTEVLKQGQYAPVSLEDQVMIIYAGVNGHLDDIPIEALARFEREFIAYMHAKHADVPNAIQEEKDISEKLDAKLREDVAAFKAIFKPDEAAAVAEESAT